MCVDILRDDLSRTLSRPPNGVDRQLVGVPKYYGHNEFVSQMLEQCRSIIDNDFVDILIHGSLGTSEEIAYSDFDAIAVLHSSSFANVSTLADVLSTLYKARSVMYSMDSLQHHGWFTIPFFLFNEYHEDYLPIAVLQNATSLGRDFTCEIHVAYSSRDSVFESQLHSFCDNIHNDLAARRYLQNLYECKSFLSKVLLLPSLFIQAHCRHGIFKRSSFEVAKQSFSSAAWSSIETASELRATWAVPKASWRFLKERPDVIGRIARRRLSGTVPGRIARRLDAKMEASTRRLLSEVRNHFCEQ